MTLMPSPGKSTTPLMGLAEKGGTKAATFEPMAAVYGAEPQVPSMIMAALPFSNCWMLAVSVSTSGLVHPLVSSFCHAASDASVVLDVQGIEPLRSEEHTSELQS